MSYEVLLEKRWKHRKNVAGFLCENMQRSTTFPNIWFTKWQCHLSQYKANKCDGTLTHILWAPVPQSAGKSKAYTENFELLTQ